jgi:Protein of unknown function with PCYCGC motif
MGRKSSAKRQSSSAGAPPEQPARSLTPLLIGGVIVAALAVGVLTFRSRNATADQAAAAAARPAAAVPAAAKLGPHPQENLPPLDLPGYQLSRPPDVIRAAYKFAAEHPEVSSYVPCFCGCDREGHRGNEDCFVAARDANGDVVQWEEHGMECAVCLDVATRSAQMYASGASVKDIRTAIDKEWKGKDTYRTPTPLPE